MFYLNRPRTQFTSPSPEGFGGSPGSAVVDGAHRAHMCNRVHQGTLFLPYEDGPNMSMRLRDTHCDCFAAGSGGS